MVVASTTGAAEFIALVGEVLLGIASKASELSASIAVIIGSCVHCVETVGLLHLCAVSLHLCLNSLVDHVIHFFLRRRP